MIGTYCSVTRGLNFGRNGVLRPSYNVNGFVNVGPGDVASDGICNVRLSSISTTVTRRLCRATDVIGGNCRGISVPSGFCSLIVAGMPFNSFGMSSGGCSGRGPLVRSCFFVGSLSGIEANNVVVLVASGNAVSGRGDGVEECVTRETSLLNTVELPGSAFGNGTNARMMSSVLILRGESEVLSVRPR